MAPRAPGGVRKSDVREVTAASGAAATTPGQQGVGDVADKSAQVSERASSGASRRVADYLRNAILAGEIGVGQRIPQETLATRLGASRLPVREALRTLEGEGLVILEPNKGARVTNLDAEELRVLLYIARGRPSNRWSSRQASRT